MTISRYSLSDKRERERELSQFTVKKSFSGQTNSENERMSFRQTGKEGDNQLVQRLTRGHHNLMFVGPDSEEHEFITGLQVSDCGLGLGCKRVQQSRVLHRRSIVHSRPNGNSCRERETDVYVLSSN